MTEGLSAKLPEMDMDLAYENVGFIPHGEEYPEMWEMAATQWRQVEHAVGRARLNHPYGPAERNQMDVFHPAGRAKGLLVFVHGGYWRRFDRKDWSHFAQGATAADWAVAMPSYTLAPQAKISQITQEIAQAVTTAVGLVQGPIVLAGHSAGGHLVARMACPDVDLAPGIAARLKHIVPISPVSDLRPLLQTRINEDLRLDAAEAAAESPALLQRPRDVPVTVWVGAEERPVFLDQAMWLADAWETAELRVAAGCHHFDVIDGLLSADSPMMQSIMQHS